MPQIQGESMPGMQRSDSNLGDIYARRAETRLRFKADLCPGCRDLTQIQG